MSAPAGGVKTTADATVKLMEIVQARQRRHQQGAPQPDTPASSNGQANVSLT